MGTELERIDGNPQGLISLALERQADPKVLEKLMELQERWENNHARKAYIAAMTGFKQEVPAVLKKTDRVDFTSAKGRTAYNYANLGSIVQEITACLGKHELSASWSTEQKGNDVTVTCHITHGAGYRESVTLTGPIDESGNKNRIQAVGSTVTYLQRYTLLAALGLATGEDDDGNAATGKKDAERSLTEAPKKEQSKPAALSDADLGTMRMEMAEWFQMTYGTEAEAEFAKMTGGKIANPLTIKAEGNVVLAYKKYLELRGKVENA